LRWSLANFFAQVGFKLPSPSHSPPLRHEPVCLVLLFV
jgi:hypothetical protein